MSKGQTSGLVATAPVIPSATEAGFGRRGHGAGLGLAEAFRTLLLWQNRARQRSHLSELDGHLLADMGLSPDEAAREAAKPFWRG